MIACKLVHDTGTMIRFRTSQLGALPSASGDIQLLLPTGRVVNGYFNRHRQNPNVSGRELVRYIKQRLRFGEREDVLLERRIAVWVVHLLSQAISIAGDANIHEDIIKEGDLQVQDFTALVALADREHHRGARVGTYKRMLRPAGLRRLVMQAVGCDRCMVQDCNARESFEATWGPGCSAMIIDVHHIEKLAHTVDHHPRNLCVLCANHHRFVHGAGSWNVRHDGTSVVLRRPDGELVIRRPDAFGI